MITLKNIDRWLETFYEVVSEISVMLLKNNTLSKLYEENGRNFLYDLARKITDDFEEKYKDVKFEGEFFEAIDLFLDDYLSESSLKKLYN